MTIRVKARMNESLDQMLKRFKIQSISNGDKNMAEKKVISDFNMAAEIRKLLRGKRSMMGREVYDALVENFPNQNINKDSCLVAFSKNRVQMGLAKKVVKKKSVAKKVVKKNRPSAAVTAVNLTSLQAAAKFVAQIGDSDKAIAAIKQLESVQIR